MRKPSEVVLGRIRGVFGVHGWVRVESFTEEPLDILDYTPWSVYAQAGVLSLVPLQGRWQGPGLVVQLGTPDGGVITDREYAQTLLNAEITVPRSALPTAGEDEIYLVDLVGMRVHGSDGHDFGRITRVLDNGVQPVMELDEGAQLIPFVRGPVVTRTDVAAGVVTLAWTAEYAL